MTDDYLTAREKHLRGMSDALLSGMMPPPSNGTVTSDLAAVAITPHAATQRITVLSAIVAMDGATRQQVEEYAALDGNSVRPRVRELLKAGWIEEGVDYRRTASGQFALVLHATEMGRQILRRAA